MNIAHWCIKNNRTTFVILFLIILAGLRTFFTISRLEDPEFTIRTALVITYFPGASPIRVEELVTDKLEKKIREIPEIERLTSESMAGVSVITVDVYEKYNDMKPIWDKLRNKVVDAKSALPAGVIDSIVNDEFGDVFGIVAALTGDGYTYREMKDVADRVRDQLLKLDSVAKVNFFGTQEERVFIEFSNVKLAEYGYSPYQLAQMLKAQNIIQPGGNASVGSERVVIEATGEFKSIDQIGRTSLRVPGRSEAITLADIATVKRDFVDPPTSFARFNGEQSIILAISMAKGGNLIHLGKMLQQELKRIQKELPVGLDFQFLVYQPKFVNRSISNFMENLLEAFGFVFIVVLCFTGIRTGLVTGSLVPVAMLLCVALMPLFNVVLQQVSIAALIISLGILVDNGIVISENILVRLGRGEDRLIAACSAVKELWVPLLTSSLTIMITFLPIAIAKSSTGEYCISLFIVVSVSLLGSWFLSLTMMPLLSMMFLKSKHTLQLYEGSFYRKYRSFLIYSLKRPWRVILFVMIGTIIAVLGFQWIPNIFFPPNEREMFLVELWQPYGSDIRATVDNTAKLEKFLLKDSEVESVGSFVGSGGPRWYLALRPEHDNPSYSLLIVNTKDLKNLSQVMTRTRNYIENHFPDNRFTVKKLAFGPPVGAPIQIRISGDDIDKIYSIRDRIASVLAPIPGVENIYDDWGEWTKKLMIDVNQEQAKRAGFTSQDIALSLQTQFSGFQATEFREGKEIIPMVVRSKEAYREDLGRIEGLSIYSYQNSRNIPLLHVAHSKLIWQPSNIHRRNHARTLTLNADVSGRFAHDVFKELVPKVSTLQKKRDWPEGYNVEFGGENVESDKAQSSIKVGLPLALGLMFLTLVFQFNSVRYALIILLTIPPMMIGVTLGLILTRVPFGFMAFLGLVSLAGLIVSHTIIMIDRMEIEKRGGLPWQDAIVVSAQRRLRPILMTVIATIVGLIPLSLHGGMMWRPMANVIIFGLGFASFLTLILCPVLSSLFFRVHFKDYFWNPDALKKSMED